MSGGTALMEREGTVAATDVLTRREGNAAMALALMPEADFEARLKLLKTGQDRVARIQRELMTEGEDYGVIPGTPKPTLFKPGAEKLCQFYYLVPRFVERTIEGDGETTPHLRVRVTCYLHHGSEDGPIVGEGVGAANSWEKKYRYRTAQRECPACGVPGAIRRSRYDDKGWYCWDKAGGCGAKFPADEPDIVRQELGMVDNPDPYDAENTFLKMATKRAQVDAVLRTTATSGLFAQDLEDEDEEGEAKGKGEKKARPAAPKAAERRSSSARANEAPGAAKEAQGSAEAHQGGHIGRIRSVEGREVNGDRFFEVSLNTGFACGTRQEEIAKAAAACKDANSLVELICQPAKTKGNKPKLLEIVPAALGE
jgi:hypothetical protein